MGPSRKVNDREESGRSTLDSELIKRAFPVGVTVNTELAGGVGQVE